MNGYESLVFVGILTYVIFLFIKLIKLLVLKIMSVGAEKSPPPSIIVSGKGCCEDLEFRVRSAATHRYLFGVDTKIMILDLGFDEETKKVAKILSETINGVEICADNDVSIFEPNAELLEEEEIKIF